ncbi:MAG: HEPN domain-containing protein [Saprospiraceae bacterium]
MINYRIKRAKDTLDDASILLQKEKKWNSSINRLYYTVYAVMALLLYAELKPTTHNGAKSNFSSILLKQEKLIQNMVNWHSQLFTWRQKGDYDDLFDFDKDKVMPYFEPIN